MLRPTALSAASSPRTGSGAITMPKAAPPRETFIADGPDDDCPVTGIKNADVEELLLLISGMGMTQQVEGGLELLTQNQQPNM